MCKIIKSIGHGLLAAGVLLVIINFVGVSLRGREALGDAVDPFAIRTYLTLRPLMPGAFLLWLGGQCAERRRRYANLDGQTRR